jgi:ParB family chromosome partitioning protein
MPSKVVLGKGLKALIPGAIVDETTGTVSEIQISKIHPNPFQPRQDFDDRALQELKDSIVEKGIIQPITVRARDGEYQVIAGERRLRACQSLGRETIPAFVMDVKSDEDMLEIALIENVQREKLNPIELAISLQRLIDECHLTQDDVAKKIGKDRSTITNFLRILKLPEEIKDSIRKDQLSMGHARALLGLKTTEEQIRVWKLILSDNISVRKVEEIAKETNPQTIEKKKKATVRMHNRPTVISSLEEKLRTLLGTRVRINRSEDGGEIKIEFYSDEDLERLIEIFEVLEKRW